MDVEFLKYRFEEKYENVTPHKFKIGVRHLQILYMIVISIVVGLHRGSVGATMLALTDESRLNDTYIKIHTWDRSTQGIFLFAFFFGYAAMIVPAELWLRRIGGRYIQTAVLAVSGGLCAAMPTIINRGDYSAVFSAQLFMGMAQSGLSPANRCLLEKWLPPDERNKFSWLVYGGVLFGIIIGLPVAGRVSEEELGWELIYYSLAMISLSMAVITFALTASSPDEHPALGESEKEFLESVVTSSNKKNTVSWREIFKSPQFWGIAFAHVFSNTAFIFYLTDVPLFLRIFRLTLRESACWAAVPFAILWVTYMIMKPVVQLLVACFVPNTYEDMSFSRQLVNPRKIVNFISAAVFLFLPTLSALVPDSLVSAFVLLLVISAALGLQYLGFLENMSDATDKYRDDVVMLCTTFASVVGSFYPLISGFILRSDVSGVHNWKNLFLFLTTLCVVCNLIFFKFATSYKMEIKSKVQTRPNNSVYSPIEMEILSEKDKNGRL
ncbi:putative inorganic phosphate cotransporter [Plodia interpunctella]|uniref:putative inorganic phosphate cotransporter n=1 Tax=Plodia interpunctella TaxID=58824 RepID=UPI0023689EA5|nr:putative inorganic phosphate cotransporter [Plodia interpunctella]